MDDTEARVRCVAMAMEQSKLEGRHGRTETVLEIAKKFADFALGTSKDAPKRRGRPPKSG